ncbi:MAG TPA: GatB/YqeY domain-containing protein, partial [Burkholderiales bacterium]|nr:GatB/YqeY domain-containing protein [Burkholderiales bacterium]
MSLKDKITEDMKAAMRARDAARLSAVRLLLSGIKQREVDERKELTDAEVVSVIEKMIKQRRESIAQYEKAGREDLAGQE